jgi:hypothetical protein
VVKSLHTLIRVLSLDYNQEEAASLHLGLVSTLLGRFRAPLSSHLTTFFTPDRSRRPLLYLAALYHDAGKASTREIDPSGRVRFFKHEMASEEIMHRRAQALMLSNPEIDHLTRIRPQPHAPTFYGADEGSTSRRTIYRFFVIAVRLAWISRYFR